MNINILDVACALVTSKYRNPIELKENMGDAVNTTLDYMIKIRQFMDSKPKLSKHIIEGDKISDQLKYYYRKRKNNGW